MAQQPLPPGCHHCGCPGPEGPGWIKHQAHFYPQPPPFPIASCPRSEKAFIWQEHAWFWPVAD